MKRFLLSISAAFVLSASSVLAQGQGKVVLAFDTEPPGLDPTVNASTATSAATWMNVYEGLTRYTEKGEIEGSLAESWTVDLAKVFTFKLRAGVKFHDSSEFNADDVKFALERAGAAGLATFRHGQVEQNFVLIPASAQSGVQKSIDQTSTPSRSNFCLRSFPRNSGGMNKTQRYRS